MTAQFIGRTFSSLDDLAGSLGMTADEGRAALLREVDWGYGAIPGLGLPNGIQRGWFLALHASSWSFGDTPCGWLIATAIGASPDERGDRMLLAGPFTQPEFESANRAFAAQAPSTVTMEPLVDWLRANL